MPITPFLRPIALAATLAGMLALSACSDTVTRANYQRVHKGMTMAQVTAILGEPDDLKAVGFGELSGSTAVWRGHEDVITIGFANGEAVFTTLNPR